MVDAKQGLTRRQALTRGAAVGGTLLWVAPAAQVLNMTAASAADPSAPVKALSNFVIIVTFLQKPPTAKATWETGKQVALKCDVGGVWGWDTAPNNPTANCLAEAVKKLGAVTPSSDTLAWFNANRNSEYVNLGASGTGMLLQLNAEYFRAVGDPVAGTPYAAMGKNGTSCNLAAYQPAPAPAKVTASETTQQPVQPVAQQTSDTSSVPTKQGNGNGNGNGRATATPTPTATGTAAAATTTSQAPVFDTYAFA